ncbi:MULTISPECIES: twin-arginine translocase TatA/TatE family subunit [Paenibacillus]|uniref:Sec-independent protein translocase protein TatA n=1 Tax=Paenibacillus glycanilyticus TaxID=126569 RepID=A0ABQ6NMW9_9BACL|nr:MULTISPECIES: twin-arginine translocase TatA/TatE family subunit [Paenibacillus]ACS99719.1 twin-arginine translocation protein, TatA/E family subunit [Paenibacillus sp. JDR-2]MCK9857024.1 twin-arginine translocase TatA/TatE family subunit [Paenibacillus sp. ATY16]GMK46446.1 Sec-independent protein translocase protein TatAd [Paenibacillus glycanilyticus]
MSGIGATGFILLAIVALLLFGPNKLPELGRAFGRTLKEFKAGARDMMDDEKDNKRVEVNRTENIEVDNKRLPD